MVASILKLATLGLLAASANAVPVVSRPMQKRGTSTKRGAAYNDADLVTALSDSSSTMAWAYNWGSSQDGDIPDGVSYVPMLWGSDSDFVDGWVSAVETALDSGSEYILGFNEPDSSTQADMTASEAATYYKEYITPYSGDASLVSPAVTSSTSSGEGLDWMESFLEACDDCDISAIAVHWYGSDVSEFKSFVQEAIDLADDYDISSVWITEFGLDTDESGISDLTTAATFVSEASQWLEEQSAVTHYAFFYCANDYMLTDSVVNSVGDAYVAVGSSSSSTSTSTSSSSSSSTTTSSTTSVAAEATTLVWTEPAYTTTESEVTYTTWVALVGEAASSSTSTPEPVATSTAAATSFSTSTTTMTSTTTVAPVITPSPTSSSVPVPTVTVTVTLDASLKPEGDDSFVYGACGASSTPLKALSSFTTLAAPQSTPL
ncbi:hypothetical protein N7488_008531 [Penicillium malachiteum]|nr:hypothetical protein N7488_008531 [Penicillium malachiteum]